LAGSENVPDVSSVLFERTYLTYDFRNFPTRPLKLTVKAWLREKAVDSI